MLIFLIITGQQSEGYRRCRLSPSRPPDRSPLYTATPAIVSGTYWFRACPEFPSATHLVSVCTDGVFAKSKKKRNPATDLERGQRYLHLCCSPTHPPLQTLPLYTVGIVGASVQGKTVRSIDRGRTFPPKHNARFLPDDRPDHKAGAGWN